MSEYVADVAVCHEGLSKVAEGYAGAIPGTSDFSLVLMMIQEPESSGSDSRARLLGQMENFVKYVC